MNYIIFDLEATCWQNGIFKDEQEIIEIGALKLDGYGHVLSTFRSFVKPVIHPMLSSFCTHLTGIEQDDVHNAPKFERLADQFIHWLEDDYLLCSWGAFDEKLLRSNCEMNQLDDSWIHPYLDLKQEYKEMRSLSKKVGLVKALKMEGEDFEGQHHRAYDDAQNLAKIFVKYLGEWPV